MPRESFSPEGRCRLCSEAVCVNFTVLPCESSFIPLISRFLGGRKERVHPHVQRVSHSPTVFS